MIELLGFCINNSIKANIVFDLFEMKYMSVQLIEYQHVAVL